MLRFSFEEFIAVFLPRLHFCLRKFDTCFPHCIYLLSLFNFQDSFFDAISSSLADSCLLPPIPLLPGGHKWTRTTDLTLIRRAL